MRDETPRDDMTVVDPPTPTDGQTSLARRTPPRARATKRPARRTASKTAPKVTERDMLDCLNVRYGKSDTMNGKKFRKYSRAEHVPRGLQFRRDAIADYMAADMQGYYSPSVVGVRRTHLDAPVIHWHEVKVSRADWLTELKDPGKSEWFRQHSHFWWLVVSDVSIVRDDLPEGWGLMVKHGKTLRVVVQAPPHPEADPMPPTMMGALLRATVRTETTVATREALAKVGHPTA